MQGTGTLIIGAGLAVTGIAMLWILGPELLTQPWLLVALTLYAINLVVAARHQPSEPAGAHRSAATAATTRPGAGGRGSSAMSPTAWPG